MRRMEKVGESTRVEKDRDIFVPALLLLLQFGDYTQISWGIVWTENGSLHPKHLTTPTMK